jgi:hypothetical protein
VQNCAKSHDRNQDDIVDNITCDALSGNAGRQPSRPDRRSQSNPSNNNLLQAISCDRSSFG